MVMLSWSHLFKQELPQKQFEILCQVFICMLKIEGSAKVKAEFEGGCDPTHEYRVQQWYSDHHWVLMGEHVNIPTAAVGHNRIEDGF